MEHFISMKEGTIFSISLQITRLRKISGFLFLFLFFRFVPFKGVLAL